MASISTHTQKMTYTYIIIKTWFIKYICSPNLRKTNYCLWVADEVGRSFSLLCPAKGFILFSEKSWSQGLQLPHSEWLDRQRSEAPVKNMSQSSPLLLQINSNKYFNILCEVCMGTYNIHAHILYATFLMRKKALNSQLLAVGWILELGDYWTKEVNLIVFEL